MDNSSLWEGLNAEKRHHVVYPAETVVRFVKKNFKVGAKILDDGCGAGRHIKFLADEGYVPFGIDITKSGVATAKKLLGDSEFENNIKVAGCDKLPFEDESFDGAISYGVLYYLTPEAIEKSMAEIYRVLKPGGKFMLHVRNTDDYRFDYSKLVEGSQSDCYIDEGDTLKSANKESGMIMHFFDREELHCLCKDFNNVTVNTERIGHNEDTFADVNYIVEGVK